MTRQGVIGVLYRVPGEKNVGEYLVIERSLYVRAPGMLCFPGGAIESGETEEQAVRRELREELNLTIEPIRRLWQSYTPSGVELFWWLIAAHDDQTPSANPLEVNQWWWMSPTDLQQHPKTLPTNLAFLDAVRSGHINVSTR